MANSERGKYADLIDEQVWAFIERSVSCFPADAGKQSMATQRALYNVMSQQFYAGRPASVTAHDYESHTYQPLIFISILLIEKSVIFR